MIGYVLIPYFNSNLDTSGFSVTYIKMLYFPVFNSLKLLWTILKLADSLLFLPRVWFAIYNYFMNSLITYFNCSYISYHILLAYNLIFDPLIIIITFLLYFKSLLFTTCHADYILIFYVEFIFCFQIYDTRYLQSVLEKMYIMKKLKGIWNFLATK